MKTNIPETKPVVSKQQSDAEKKATLMEVMSTWRIVEQKQNELFYLYQRWQDEREYEDFADYTAQMKTYFPDFEFLKFNKRPFGFVARLKCGLAYQVKVNSNSLSGGVARG